VPSNGVTLCDGRHGLLVVLPFGYVVEMGIAQGLLQQMMAQQFFEDFQGHARIEELGGKGVA
jgi:hypothetical protein